MKLTVDLKGTLFIDLDDYSFLFLSQMLLRVICITFYVETIIVAEINSC